MIGLNWWTWFPVQLRRISKLFSEAWIDGVYLTAWPWASLAAPLLALFLGLFEGATHWTIQSIPNGFVSAHVVDFTQMVPLLFIAAICGALSAQLGLLLVTGFALGDLFLAKPVFGPGLGVWWNVFHLHVPQLICYLAFFLLAATPALTAKAMVANLSRWLGKPRTPQLVLSAGIACVVQGVSVYAWTIAAAMIVRVHWLWARQTPPFAVFDFMPEVDPWLPLAATIAMGVRFWLSVQARGKLDTAAVTATRREMTTFDRQHSVNPVLSAIGSGLVTTALISGLFDSVSRGLLILVIVTGLFLLRNLVLPSVGAWSWWSRMANRVPLLLRWISAFVATFALTRWILTNPRMAPGANAAPGAFGVEIFCFLLGLVLSIALLPFARQTELPSSLRKSAMTGVKIVALICVLSLATRPVFAGICLDPFCCFGANPLVAALAVAALLLVVLPFALELELGFLGELLFDAIMSVAPESVDAALLQGEMNAVVAEEEFDAALDKGIDDLLASDIPGDQLEGEVAQALRNEGFDIQKLNAEFGPNGMDGEIDIETSDAIIEITKSPSGRLSDIRDLMDPSMNPSGKPVILYAPSYGNTAGRAIENIGGWVVRNLPDLFGRLKSTTN